MKSFTLPHSSRVNLLIEIKERLKDDVMNPLLKWNERAELYKAIQEINEQIHLLVRAESKDKSVS